MTSGERPKHDWSVSEKVGGMKIEDYEEVLQDPLFQEGGGHVLLPDEAERVVEGLQRFELSEVGSEKWMKQHGKMEKLNQQAHACVRDKKDEFVLEALLTFEKTRTLIHDLVVSEAWRECVLPRVRDTICSPGPSEKANGTRPKTLRAYFVLYHEVTLMNLLEVVCYHGHAVAAMKDDAVDLIDYCARRLVALQARAQEFRDSALAGRMPSKVGPKNYKEGVKVSAAEFAAEIAAVKPEDELARQTMDIEFSCSVACMGVVRFLCQHVSELGVSAAARLLDHHDILLTVIPLIENPPWTRVRVDPEKKTRTWEKLDGSDWKPVARDRLLEVTKLEAQAWLAVFSLVMHPQVRQRYGFDAFRKQTLLRARKYLNDVVLDQIPVLADMQRFMDELALIEVPQPTALADRGGLVLEQVAGLRDAVLRKADFDAVAKRQIDNVWGPDAPVTDKDLAPLADIYIGPDGVLDHSLELPKHDAEEKVDASSELPPQVVDGIPESKDALPPPRNQHREQVPAGGSVSVSPPPPPPDAQSKPLIQEIDDAKVSPPPPEQENGGIRDDDSLPSPSEQVVGLDLLLDDGPVALDRDLAAQPKIVPAPDGRPFTRVKWTPGDRHLFVPADRDLAVRVRFASGNTRTLVLPDLDLPDAFDPMPPLKLWRQVGDVEDDLAAQVLLLHRPQEPDDTRPVYRAVSIFLASPELDSDE